MVTKQLINLEPVKESIKAKLLEKYESTVYMNTNIVEVKLDIKDMLEQYIETQHLADPNICITADAYIKMRKLVDETNTEIGWYGIVSEPEGLDATYVIEDILVYPQRVTGSTCEQDDNKMFDFELSLSTEEVNHKRFQGHSHVNMGVVPSGVDEQFYKDLLSQVNDYFIIAVTNKRKDLTLRFYDIRNNIVYNGLDMKVISNDGTDLDDWYLNNIENLTTPIVKPDTSKGWPTSKDKYKGATYAETGYKILDDDDWYADYKLGNPYDSYEEDKEDLMWQLKAGYINKKEFDQEMHELERAKKGKRKK